MDRNAKICLVGSKLEFDATKPDGTPRKLEDVSRSHAFGWRHSVDLERCCYSRGSASVGVELIHGSFAGYRHVIHLATRVHIMQDTAADPWRSFAKGISMVYLSNGVGGAGKKTVNQLEGEYGRDFLTGCFL